MPRYWECPSCRALLTRERLEAAAGVCPYCDARVGPPADFADPDAPPAEPEGARRLASIAVPATIGGKLATAAKLLVEQLPLIAGVVLLFKLPTNTGLEIILERRGAGAHPLAPIMLKFVVELFFDPVATAAVLVALAGRMSGRATPFPVALRAGLDSWWWLFAARLVKQLTIMAVGLGLLFPELGPARVVFAIPMLVLVVRYALVDEAVVLDHTPVLESRRRSSELVTGRAWQVVGAGFGSLVALLFLAQLTGQWAERLGLVEDPLARGLLVTLFDVLAVYNTIVLFLIYWEARSGPAGEIAPRPTLEEDSF
ncbi:MAG: hypothetical protein BGO49_02135 [Planctomycetales bacterium 71-10]|nr:MAG: hypothetical protein BGO49_02135 [Planctomycetales bacterium 71-10]